MNCIILAAGYATRLYPLTKNFPKPLLEVGDKTILDWLISDLDKTGEIEGYYVVSNHKFAPIFEDWAKKSHYPITVLDDGTESNETRLGAVKDILFALNTCGYDSDVLVIAGDNLLDFSLSSFLSYAKEKSASCVMRYFEPDEKRLTKCGVLEVAEDGKILSMEEKPEKPKSNWCCPPFYFYKKEDAKRVSDGIEAGCGVDAPGSFIAWLCGITDVYAMEMPGSRYDIGTVENYNKIKEEYKGIGKLC